MAKAGRPRRGSLQFSPRKRAKSLNSRVRNWPHGEGLQGFVGYKVGMLSAFVNTDNAQSPMTGKDIVKPVTLIEVPPMILKSIRTYKKTHYGAKIITETSDAKSIDAGKVDFARLMFQTQPSKAGHPAKMPNSVEVAFGKDLAEIIGFASKNIGKEVKFSDFFESSQMLDVTGVTRGRGFQGTVKRFGVKLLPSKAEKSRRKVGSLGPWTPKRTPWQVPMAGQTGYHTRTEHNKQVLHIGEGLNPKSGWHRYGVIKSDCVIVLGTVQGPQKRQLKLRKAIRSPKGDSRYSIQKLIIDGEAKKL